MEKIFVKKIKLKWEYTRLSIQPEIKHIAKKVVPTITDWNVPDWEERPTQPRKTARSQNYKGKVKNSNTKVEAKEDKKEVEIQKSVVESPTSDDIHYDIGAVTSSSFLTSVYDYNIRLGHYCMKQYIPTYWLLITALRVLYHDVLSLL